MIELTVLGCAGTHTGVGRACSGYLVRAGGTALLLDAGNGSTSNLQRIFPLRDLDAIVISHRHVDHCIDLISCFYNLLFDDAVDRRMPLFAAAEVYEMLSELLAKDSPMIFGDAFDHTQVGDGDRMTIGPMELSFAHANHPPPSVSTRIEVEGATFVYSGDTAGGTGLVELAKGADLFLCEATWVGTAEDHVPGIHLTAADAGRIARRAEVNRLVLTHIARATDRDRVLEEASATFDGPVELAEDLATYVIGPAGRD